MLRKQRIYPAVWLVVVLSLMGIAAVAIFVSQASVRVVDLTPKDGDDAVPITAAIRVTFSHDMDAASVEERFSIEPEVAGDFSWEGRTLAFRPHSALLPDTTYSVTIDDGATSQRGRPLREGTSFGFHTRVPQLLYLGRPYEGAEMRQLFLVSSDSGPALQLTEHAGGVWDYTIDPEGQSIIYSALREDGGSDLWRMDRDGTDQRVLLACPEAACLNPAWSPDGQQIAYERRDVWSDAPNLDPKAGRIWLLDLEEGKERPLFDYDVPLHSPVWAPQGERMAYVSPMLPGVEVVDLNTEELQQFGNEWGAAPVWSPDGSTLIVPELMLVDEALVVRLVCTDLGEDKLLDISGDEDLVKDAGPAWSPGGGWIAFGRQYLDEARWTPGRQIWLTRPDGSEAYSLLTEQMGDHYAFAWRPDGAALAYVRIDLSEGPQPVPDVSVWVFDLVEREAQPVADEGVLPKWLP
jgi:Tol biopolymer transport system component